MADGFCRKLLGEDVAFDYAKKFRAHGFNVLVWYWAQYSWSPAKHGELIESGGWYLWGKEYDIGTEVSPKIWADDYIRRWGKGMRGTPAGNPLWAKFSDAKLCLGKQSWECKLEHDEVFKWTKTETDKDEFDPNLAIGNTFAESLLAIAPALSKVETFHLVGNSYGSQVVLHATYLVLEKAGLAQQTKPCDQRAPMPSIASVPVPTRLILVDPAYKQGSVLCGAKRFCLSDPILDLGIKQLQAIHNYGVPTLKLDATALANWSPGTIDTGVFRFSAATAHIKMFPEDQLLFRTEMHTQSVDWYFRTYFVNVTGGDAGSSNPCAIPPGAQAIMFGCTADAEARASFDNIVGGNERVAQLRQKNTDPNPWTAEWK
jgi:hypothetical protein